MNLKLIEDELGEISKSCERQVPDSKLVSCVRALVRVEIKKSDFIKVIVCLTFPTEYPKDTILVELKSNTIAEKLLDGLVKVIEKETKPMRGKPQCLHVIKFVNRFLDENPLSCCSEEISQIKKLTDDNDKLKLIQKSSTISLLVRKNEYFVKLKIGVPWKEYPKKQISVAGADSNFPRLFKVWFVEQAKELARQCVQPPLRKQKDPFVPKPSLAPAIKFLIECVKRYPEEICQACRQKCFPADPEKVIHDENASAHAERVYCSHCYHRDCLILYMKTPPFKDGKKCHACKKQIYHETWKVTPELAEARWAHERAKERELDEVVDFLGDLATIHRKK